MKAVVRVYWTFFTGFPVQRWLGVLGVIVLGLGLVAGLAGSLAGSPLEWGTPFGLLGFFIFALFPAAFAAGGTLRALSAPHSHRLLPFFRVRVLCAVVLFVVTIAVLWYALAAWLAQAGRPQGVEVAIIYPVGALTAIVLAMLVFTGQPNWIWIGLPLLFGFMHWMSAGGPAHLREAGVSLPWIVAVASVGAWVAFAIWYLRARYVRPVLWVTTADPARSAWPWGAAALPTELTRAAAVRVLLAGHVQRPLAQQLLIAAGIGALLCLVAPLLQYLPGQQTTTPPFTRFLWPFYAMLIMAFATHPLVRQSRFLWLRVPGARGEVLKLVERMVARLYARVAVAIVAFVLFALWVLGTPLGEAAWGVHSCARPRCIRRAWVLPRCAMSGSWSWA